MFLSRPLRIAGAATPTALRRGASDGGVGRAGQRAERDRRDGHDRRLDRNSACVSVPGDPESTTARADPSLAASFHPVRSPDAKQYTDWIGNYLFYQPIGSGGRDEGTPAAADPPDRCD